MRFNWCGFKTPTPPRAAIPRRRRIRGLCRRRTTLELSAGFQRIGSLLTQPGGGNDPTVSISGTLTSLGTASTIPIDRAENRYRYAALVRSSRGAHELTFGGGVARRQTNGFEADTHRGSISFGNAFGNDAITNFRLGLPVTYFIAVGDVYRGYRDWTGELYLGDRWRAAPNLDLTFGLRYEFMARPGRSQRPGRGSLRLRLQQSRPDVRLRLSLAAKLRPVARRLRRPLRLDSSGDLSATALQRADQRQADHSGAQHRRSAGRVRPQQPGGRAQRPLRARPRAGLALLDAIQLQLGARAGRRLEPVARLRREAGPRSC